MSDHDPLCEFVTMAGALGGISCRCHLIRQVRADERERLLTNYQRAVADEREKIAQPLDARAAAARSQAATRSGPIAAKYLEVAEAYAAAAQIARNGGRDE